MNYFDFFPSVTHSVPVSHDRYRFIWHTTVVHFFLSNKIICLCFEILYFTLDVDTCLLFVYLIGCFLFARFLIFQLIDSLIVLDLLLSHLRDRKTVLEGIFLKLQHLFENLMTLYHIPGRRG